MRSTWLSVLGLAVALLLPLASCGDADQAGAVPSALGTAAGACTFTPDEWLTRCASTSGDEGRCRQLRSAATGDERERAAFELNLWSSRTGRTTRGLGAMHFTHGTRLWWSLDYLRTLSTSMRTDVHVAGAVHDANRAFAGCVDHAIVAPWVTTPICGVTSGPDRTVGGPANAPCVALDADCRRGRYEAGTACCRQVELGAGMACQERDDTRDSIQCFEHAWCRDPHDDTPAALVCDGEGRCIDEREVPASDRVVGASAWVEAVRLDGTWGTSSVPDAVRLPDGQIEIRVDDAPVVAVPPSSEGHRLRVASGADPTLGIIALDMVGDDAGLSRSIFVPRRASASIDTSTGGSFDVCVASGRWDDLGTVLADCSGGTVVACPGAQCAIDARGFAVVTVPGLVLAWERLTFSPAPPSTDAATPTSDAATADAGPSIVPFTLFSDLSMMLGAGVLTVPGAFPPGIGGTCGLPSIPCTLSPPPTCPSGTNGRRLCAGGHYGACVPIPSSAGALTVETCNGIDDDCDGHVDEGISAACRDTTSCTIDSCTHSSTGCTHTANSGFCLGVRLGTGGGSVPSSLLRSCESDMCIPDAMPLPPHTPGTRWVPATGPDPITGCLEILNDVVCQDGCACNGSERCDRTHATSNSVTGCFVPPRFEAVSPTGPTFHDPCEQGPGSGLGDSLRCTDEVVCCEPDPSHCALLSGPSPSPVAQAEQQFCEQVLGASGNPATLLCPQVSGTHPGTGDGQSATCLNFTLPPAPAADRVCTTDGNWCTIDTITCAESTGLCVDTTTPRPLGTSGLTPGAPGDEPVVRGFRVCGQDIPPVVLPGGEQCLFVNHFCAHAQCNGGSPAAPSRCVQTGTITATIGHETRTDDPNGCWGDPSFITGVDSCYTVVCDPGGSGFCNGLVAHDEECADPFEQSPGCPRRARCVTPAVFPPRAFVDTALSDPEAYFPAGCQVNGCVVAVGGSFQCIAVGALDPAAPCEACDPSQHSVGYSYRGDGASCTAGGPDVVGTCAVSASSGVPACVFGDTCASGIDVTTASIGTSSSYLLDTCTLTDDVTSTCGMAGGRDGVLGVTFPGTGATYDVSVPTGWIVEDLGSVTSPCATSASRCSTSHSTVFSDIAGGRFFWAIERADGTCGVVSVTVVRES